MSGVSPSLEGTWALSWRYTPALTFGAAMVLIFWDKLVASARGLVHKQRSLPDVRWTMPERVSPSLVEAAARAMCANAGIPDTDGTHWQQFTGGAEAVLVAVGDALRLEGAQAENARIKTDIERSPSYTQRLGQWVSIHDIWDVLDK